MEAAPLDELPRGGNWLFEPKYDGFRCIVFRDGDRIDLQSKKQKSLNRFFPEVVSSLAALHADRFVLDGELVIPGAPFETLQLRLHPAARRIAELSGKFPARLIVFDLLEDRDGPLLDKPFSERRDRLKAFLKPLAAQNVLVLSQAARSAATAQKWLAKIRGIDGIVAKPLDQPYHPGERIMRKFKVWHTVDAVLGGYYQGDLPGSIDSLLFGLYDDDGRLNFVGGSRVYADAAQIHDLLEPLKGSGGFTGRRPTKKNRWSGKEQKFVPLRPALVAELSADHISGGQFRHGSRLIRWRTDKAPEDCTMDQL